MQASECVPVGRQGRFLVAGIGNRWRGDDAAGLLVAEQLALLGLRNVEVRQLASLGPELLDLWCRDLSVVVADAVITGASPGTILRVDLLQQPADWSSSVSSHAFGLPSMVGLARVLDRLPERLMLYGIEAGSLELSDTLSPAVARAIAPCVGLIACEIANTPSGRRNVHADRQEQHTIQNVLRR